jgi:hypothetical protein
LENGVDSGSITGHLFFTCATAAMAAMAAQTIMPWHHQLAQSLALGRWRRQRQQRWWQCRRQCHGIASSLACSRGDGGSSGDDGVTALPAVCLLSCLLACATVAVAEAVQTTMPRHHQLDCCLGITSLLACSLACATAAAAVAAVHMMMPWHCQLCCSLARAMAAAAAVQTTMPWHCQLARLIARSRQGDNGGGTDDDALALPA